MPYTIFIPFYIKAFKSIQRTKTGNLSKSGLFVYQQELYGIGQLKITLI